MRCTPVYRENVLICSACGLPFESVTASDLAAIGGDLAKIQRGCGGRRPEAGGIQAGPSLARRAANFAKAAAGHVRRGLPKCTQEQIDARLAICQACDLYQVNPRPSSRAQAEGSPTGAPAGTCTHSSCGCPVTRWGRFRNKLAWADQACPLGKWAKVTAEGL